MPEGSQPTLEPNVEPIEIQEEVERSFLDYAMSVIVSRALPDARDGLKPVHRRIIYGMYDRGLRPERQRSKNIKRDNRMTVLIQAAHDPWDWAEVRGRVVATIEGQRAHDHINELSQKYLGTDFRNAIGPRGRVILVLQPTKVNTAKARHRGK